MHSQFCFCCSDLFNWLLGKQRKTIHKEYGIKWEKKVREEQNKRKDAFHFEVETESICLIVSDRTVPQMLSSLNKVDLLLTICQQIPNKHHFSFTGLLASGSHMLCPIKTHRNKQTKYKYQSKSYSHAIDLSQVVSMTAPE